MNALFIGNSFTARNNVPGLIAQLAAARGASFTHHLIQAGGASLRQHWNGGKPQTALSQHRFDIVILQEQSTLPVKNAARMHENVRLFDEPIKTAGAKLVLYMTWARQHAPESQQAITDAYTSIGQELGATLVPAGLAWERVLRTHAEPVLHDRDGSHPTIAGSYLAACVFLAVLFNETPVGIDVPVKDLTDPHRLLLQKAAWETVGRKATTAKA